MSGQPSRQRTSLDIAGLRRDELRRDEIRIRRRPSPQPIPVHDVESRQTRDVVLLEDLLEFHDELEGLPALEETTQDEETGQQPQLPAVVVEGPRLGNFMLIINAIHVFCGASIYSMPYALREGGWFSLAALAIFAMFSLYCARMLQCCFRNNPNMRTYADMGGAAFGSTGRYILMTVEFMLSYASCVEATIIARDILHQLDPSDHPLGILDLTSTSIIVTYFVIVMSLAAWVEDTDFLDRFFTCCGVIFTILGVGTLTWIFLREDYKSDQEWEFINVSGFSMAFGFHAYAYAGHPYLAEVHTSMVDRRAYWRVMLYIYVPVTFFYASTAIIGYWMFGEEVESNYLLSLPKRSNFGLLARMIVLVHQLIRFALAIWPMARAIRNIASGLPIGNRARGFISYTLRYLAVFTAIGLSLVAPIYGPLMSFLGSLLGTLAACIIPCVCYLRLEHGRMTLIEEIVICILIVVSSISAILGAQKSYREMGAIIDDDY